MMRQVFRRLAFATLAGIMTVSCGGGGGGRHPVIHLGIRLRDMIGVDSLQWGSDYPHMESTFPRSQQALEEILADCPTAEKAKIAGGNAARVYCLD